MEETRQSLHGQWSSRWAFVLAATGAAVGLGNIWKFPYIVGENGGGAFVLFYLICIVVMCPGGVEVIINTFKEFQHELRVIFLFLGQRIPCIDIVFKPTWFKDEDRFGRHIPKSPG